MKLRIRGNSIRLRLVRSEVARLAAEGRVEERIAFGAGDADGLTYALVLSPEASAVTARLTPGAITVVLPAGVAATWAGTDEVTITAEQPGVGPQGGDVLRILVEKDFTCLHTGCDELGETYARPDGGAAGVR
jgi:hypothetical protein